VAKTANKTSGADMTTNKRFDWLDGLRAFAVVLVLMGHAKLAFQFELGRVGDALLRRLNGHLGVKIFFVISGFIITLLLIREKETSGTINLRAFWRRRSFRILPALWVLLLALACLQIFGLVTITPSTWLASFLFLRNHVGEGWFTGHLWSLGVEAQFYLLWPIFVAHWPVSWLRIACISGVFLAVAFRFMAAMLVWPELAVYSLLANLDLLMLGAMCAIYVSDQNPRAQTRQPDILTSALSRKTAWLSLAAVGLASAFLMSTRWSAWATIFEPVLIGTTVTLLIMHVHGTPQGIARQILSYAPISLLGLWSYSLYLWQQLFLVHHSIWSISWVYERPWAWALVLAFVTLASYYLVEQRFNRWGHKRAHAAQENLPAPNQGAPVISEI
jgi:peptidoglycan/LPS O-acetylase OafA/YrhL